MGTGRMMIILFTILYLSVIQRCSGHEDDLTAHNRTRRGYFDDLSMIYIGSVDPRSSIYRMEVARSNYIYSRDHPGAVVMNIGKRQFDAKIIYGTVASWYNEDPVNMAILQPGKSARIPAPGLFAATTLQVVNYEDVRAIFYASRGTAPRGLNQPPSQWHNVVFFDTAITKIMQIFINVQLVGNAYSHSFGAGVAAEMLFGIIFPEEDTDIWVQIKDKVEKLVNNAIIMILNAILDNDIKPLKAKIKNIVSLIDNPLVRTIYMTLVYELVGYETKFYFTASGINKQDVNLHILPLYTRTINMKIGLYSFGITYQKELNLTTPQIDLITKYRYNLVYDAIDHIRRVKNDKLDYDYDHMDPDFFYEKLMKTRTEAAVHGEHYIPYWLRVIEPEKQPKINDTTIAYSNYFGVSTPSLFREALVNLGREPLTPRLIEVSENERRLLAVKALELHYHGKWRREDVICGIRLKYEDDTKQMIGSEGYKADNLYLKGEKISILEVKGSTATIDCLNFTLTNGDSKQFGHNCSPLKQTFKLNGHYVASMYLSKDNGRKDGRFVNIAVSYQLLNPINATDGIIMPEPAEN